MGATAIPAGSKTARARDWRNAVHAAVCDSIVGWADGTVVRASRFPTYYDFNVMRVEQPSELGVAQLSARADQALAGLAHRRIDFDLVEEAERRRGEFEAAGWKTTRLVWMLFEATVAAQTPAVAVEPVFYDDTEELRLRWHLEDHPEMEYAQYKVGAREIALKRGASAFAVREQGEPIAFAQLQWDGPAAEITSVYVHPEHRGRGLGTALTLAAIEAAAGAKDLWIVADDEDRAKDLYERLGFRAAWVSEEFLRLP
jgi:ribosomal protein S18 acetylase RimI-like enzyme